MIERLWYKNSVLQWLLSPLSALFGLFSGLRRLLFKWGVLPSTHPGISVVVVGNISVGGNGKTPLVAYLCQLFSEAGYRPGILSRGYGGNQRQFPYLVELADEPMLVGDEPCLLARRTGCPVVIDPKRVRGASLLKQQGVDVIICDDGLQHYALKRDIELVVVDGERRFGNACLLPMGPLREGLWRLDTVDFVVANGTARADEVAMTLIPASAINLVNEQVKDVASFEQSVVAIAGIGNPKRFFDTLSQLGIVVSEFLIFGDHYQFSAADIPNQKTVIMTEKDAVKCAKFAHDDCWYVPVDAQLTAEFDRQILHKLDQVKRENGY